MLAEGYVNKEIADRLNLSPPTVATYIRRIYEKLQVHSRAAAIGSSVRWCVEEVMDWRIEQGVHLNRLSFTRKGGQGVENLSITCESRPGRWANPI